MLVAIIDLGTNTFNLLIAELLPARQFKVVYTTKVSVKLGKGGINNNQILPDAIERAMNALRGYKKIIDEHKVDKVYAFGTSAIRGAANGSDFVRQVKAEGIDVEVISGDKEAELIYKGVQLALDIGHKPALVMDIGGGSTEFVIATGRDILWKHSFLLGVSRLLEKFNPSDPITEKEISRVEDYLKEELKPLLDAVNKYPVSEVIGSSGSFDSFAEIIATRFHSPDVLKNKTEYRFNLNEVDIVFKLLIESNKEQRLNMKGLIQMRADMIVMAVILTRFIVRELSLNHMRLSTYSLKEGAMNELMSSVVIK